jgi:hypothetical protein
MPRLETREAEDMKDVDIVDTFTKDIAKDQEGFNKWLNKSFIGKKIENIVTRDAEFIVYIEGGFLMHFDLSESTVRFLSKEIPDLEDIQIKGEPN